ncbi:hypothetical protein D1872_289900 [compost metagenome]
MYHIDFAVEYLLFGDVETSRHRQRGKIETMSHLLCEKEAVCPSVDHDRIGGKLPQGGTYMVV